MTRRITIFVGLTLLLGVSILSAQVKGGDETIRVETKLVSIPTIVSDRDGRYVPNLKAADFTVFQDGAKQNIEFFAATEEPISVALLIDTSQSTRPVLGDIKDSAKSFLKLLGPKDRAMIVSFDYDTHFLSPLTGDQEQLKKAIKEADVPKGLVGTTLRDAVFQTVNNVFKGLTGRKAIILLTDGKDHGSQINTHDLLYRLEESDTLIYTIFFETGEQQRPANRPMGGGGGRNGGVFGGGGFPGGGRGGRGGGFPPPMSQPPRRDNPQRRARVEEQNLEASEFLQELSDMTAGRFYPTKNGKVKDRFAEIVDELRFQYRLGFYPPEDNGQQPLHELKVKVSRPDAVVRSRGSYRTLKTSN
ncbi:MAG TPA: VWA domain-containing protein [Pyrinomonadaceae bacterium]|nr:VWA domain-containing protein [Pyrinomonadaceae bacterium]